MTDTVRELKSFEANSKWLSKHYGEVSQRYSHQYVAVHNRKVVAHDRELSKLIERINTKYKETSRVIPIKYVSPEKIDLIL